MPIDTIVHGSADDLSTLSDGSIALTVTSPPYWNAIDYGRHVANNADWYRTRTYAEGYTEYTEYLDWLDGIFEQVFQKTRDGGFAALVVGTVLFKKRHYPVPYDVTARFCRRGWEFHQDIIWHKCTAGVRRAGSFIQRPYLAYCSSTSPKPGPPMPIPRRDTISSHSDVQLSR